VAFLGGPAEVTITPGADARDVDPIDNVDVKAITGTLTDVQLVTDGGGPIAGTITSGGTEWKPNAPLEYGHAYTLTANSRGPAGLDSRAVSRFSTLKPDSLTKVSFTTTSEAPIQEGGTYGVGTVIVAHFDQQVADRAAAERALLVTTNPPVQGSWFWVSDRDAHWRPEHYYTPGTTVNVNAKIYGIALGHGLFGQEGSQASFRIGDAHVSVADDASHLISVFNNGALIRTMPTSMGMGGSHNFGSRTISLWTPSGVYTVLDKGNPVVMDSASFGLPRNSSLGYRETIYNATRISSDGIYLHRLDSTVWAQGNTDTSHGCLNLNADNAKWFFDFSVPGDVVEIRNTGGPPLELAQNGDWTLNWNQWRAGSALAPAPASAMAEAPHP